MSQALSAVGFLLLSVVAFSNVVNGFIFINSCPTLSTCTIQCLHGFQTNTLGCRICACVTPTGGTGVSSSMFNPNIVSSNEQYIRPCLPHQPYCGLSCQHGYVLGSTGCQLCKCKAVSSGTSTTRTTPPSTVASTPHVVIRLSNPCIKGHETCNTLCINGYLLGPSKCQYCICRPPGMNYTSAITTTSMSLTDPVSTTPMSTTPMAVYLPNPCIKGQYVCEGAHCRDGFLLGPNGCQYCMCAPPTTTPPLNSSNPQNVHGHDSHTTTVFPGHMKNECTIALTICQIKCKHGFMADTVDCKSCICKDEVYRHAGIEKGDEPTIQLLKPCVLGVDVCNIFCSHGYLRGPQDCQYCACGHLQL